MGDPKKQRKKYSTPLRPWESDRINREARLLKDYGLKSKKEVWKTETTLRRFRGEARALMAETGEQAEKESSQLIDKLHRLGLVEDNSDVVDVLRLEIEDILGRRLQSMVYSKGMADSPSQARQMVVHGHIMVGGRCVDEPGYMVSVEEEDQIEFGPNSPFKERYESSETDLATDEVGE
ncbi:MAG: 30S ribosomal protein S4 [Candidatus Hadarchaeota archaeon]